MITQDRLPVEPDAPAVPATGLQAQHLVDMLRRHYQPENRQPAGIFAPEIGSPDGRRRADVIWLPTTVSGGNGLVGHEVKVTRQDLITELADPTKADPWAQYCTYWWLVVAHPSLVAGLDVPETWGVMAPPSGRRTRSMTIVRAAPKLNPKEPAAGIARLASWQLHNTIPQVEALQRDLAWHKSHVQRQDAEIRRLTASQGLQTPRAQKVAALVSAVERRLRDENIWAQLDEDAVVAAIVDRVATAQAAARVRQQTDLLIREVTDILAPFDRIRRDLERAAKCATISDEAAS